MRYKPSDLRIFYNQKQQDAMAQGKTALNLKAIWNRKRDGSALKGLSTLYRKSCSRATQKHQETVAMCEDGSKTMPGVNLTGLL